MSASFLRVLALFPFVLVAGCGGGSTIHKTQPFGPEQALVTSADVRLVNKTKPKNVLGGRVTPETIICAEPSPDVAKAVSESFNLGGSFGGGIPSGVSAEAAAAISLARAEGMAQLTQRLATIQLLRDGLYRACEAYANGAISDTTYAVMISRFDDTMVTMLLGELAAGNFSGRLAAIGTGAGGSASAQLNRATRQLFEAAGQLAEATRPQEEPDPAQENQDQPDQPQPDQPQPERSAEQSASSALRAAANSMAEASQLIAAESSGFRQNPQIAETIGTMQRKYIENVNLDAMVVACINALDQGRIEADISDSFANVQAMRAALDADPDSLTKEAALVTAQASFNRLMADSLKSPLAAHCMTGVLPKIADHYRMLLKRILDRADKDKESSEASQFLELNAQAIFELLEAIEKRRIDLEDLPKERAALKADIAAAREAAKTARDAAEAQRRVASNDEEEAGRLIAAAFQSGIEAQNVEATRDSLKVAHETAQQRAAEAAMRVKAAQDAATAKPDDDGLKADVERAQEISAQRAREATEAKAAFDEAVAQASQLRPLADEAERKAKAAREKAEASRRDWMRLLDIASDKEADLFELTGRL